MAKGTWETRPVTGIEGVWFNFEMAADEKDPRLVVVTDTVGILVSRDGGCRWTRSLLYEDLFPAFAPITEDVEVAGTGADRSLHALVYPTPAGDLKLVSSFDDGRTWTIDEVPAPAALRTLASVELATAETAPASYLLARALVGASTLFTRSAGDGEWRWTSVGRAPPAAGTCLSDGPCVGPRLVQVEADPSRRGTLWGVAEGDSTGQTALWTSQDDGRSWRELAAPAAGAKAALLAIAPRDGGSSVMVVDVFDAFALSRDGGRTWTVGELPEEVSGSSTSAGVFDLAYFDEGTAFAAVLGLTDGSPWAGNVLAFDGRRWKNVAPRAFAGYDRTDEEGRRLTFVELTSTRGPLIALSSTGDLMTYRR